MNKQRETKRRTKKSESLPEMLPITAMSRDHTRSIFRRSRSRSLNTPELALAHESLTHWLNGGDANVDDAYKIDDAYKNSPEATKRISDLLALVKDVVARWEKVAPQWYPYFYGTAPEPNTSERYGSTTHFDEIPRAMADYATVPFLAFQAKSKLWGVGHWPVGLVDYPHNGLMHLLQPTFRPYGEVMAAHGILEIARCGALDRIRQCDCGWWYFAKRSDGVACSETCRRRIHDQKPEVKAARKAKNAANRQISTGKVFIEPKPATGKKAKALARESASAR